MLFATLAALLAMLIKDRLPRLHHPLFDVERFGLVSRDRFFIGIARTDPLFEPDKTEDFLASLRPRSIAQVPS